MPKTELRVKPSVAEIKKLYARKKKHLLNTEPAMKKVAIYLDSWVHRNFKTEGALVGGWKPLQAGGRWGSRGFDTSAKILRDTGVMEHSFVPFTAKDNAGIGTDLGYAKKHEKGEGVPKRKILPRKKDVMKRVREILKNHITLTRSK